MGKEAVQKENWLTGEPWASPTPAPQGCAHGSQAAGVQGPLPPKCRQAGHRRAWARPFLDTRALIVSGSSAGWWPRVPCLFKNDDFFNKIKAPVFAKEMGNPF